MYALTPLHLHTAEHGRLVIKLRGIKLFISLCDQKIMKCKTKSRDKRRASFYKMFSLFRCVCGTFNVVITISTNTTALDETYQ